MADPIILVAETGSDINPQLAAQYGIHLVPMHVSMGGKTLDDGSFPPEDVCAYYDNTGKVPRPAPAPPPILSGCSMKYTPPSRRQRSSIWPIRR